MAFGTCSICSVNQAKYKCPKCSVEYCSLPCFKNPLHNHSEPTEESNPTAKQEALEELGQSQKPAEETTRDEIFARIAQDPVIQSLLKYKALQVHLSVLVKLVSDSLITKEPLAENRREIANLRLCELRIGGSEENELVEEFVDRFLHLMECSTSTQARS